MALKTVDIEPVQAEPQEAASSHSSDADDAGQSRRTRLLQHARENRMRILAGAVITLALVFGGHWLLIGRFEVKTDNAFIRADITHVATKVRGYVKTVHVEDNQHVKAGDVLVTLYADDYEASLAESKASLAQAEAAAAQSQATIASREAAVATARGDAEAARDLLSEARAAADAADADAELSSSDARRYAELAEKGWYPLAKVEAATAAETSSRAASTQAHASITARRSQLASAEARVVQAEQDLAAAQAAAAASTANIEAARARLTGAELVVGQTILPAPFDGIVTNRTIAPGQLISPGQVTMSVVPERGSYVIANFKETQVENMLPGQKVRIEVDAYPSLDVTGTVESIAPATGATFSLIPQDTATGNFTKIVQRVPVRIALDEEALDTGLMRPGLAVVATVITKDPKD